jgi:hypothetical protein
MIIDEALLAQRVLAKQDRPLTRDMTFLQNWMKRPSMGFVYLLGADADVYEKPDLADLVVIKKHKDQSEAMRVVGDFCVRLWHQHFRRKAKVLSFIH